MAVMDRFVGIPPSVLLEAARLLVENPAFQVMILAFGLLVSGLFGVMGIYQLVRRRGR